MATRRTPPKTRDADTRLRRAPTVRTFTDWNPRRLKSAALAADSGMYSQAVSVCEWLLSDDRVTGALDARLDALLGLVPTFEPGAGRRKGQAIRALEAGEDYWECYPETELRLMHSWGLLFGVSVSRHDWEDDPDHGGRMLPRLKFWHPQTLQRDQSTMVWSIENALHQRITVTPGDAEWVLHTPFGDDRPHSRGLWRSLADWVLLKHYARSDWAKVGENGSLLVATSPEGSTKAQRLELASDLQSRGEDTSIALAAGFDLKLLEATANTRQIYQAQIEMADLAIAIRIRGSNLSTNVEGGSLAAAKSQERSGEQPKLRFDAEAVSTTIHDQGLTWWAEFNFGDRRLAPWPKYPVEPKEDKKARSETEEKAFAILDKAEKLGLEVDRSAFLEQYDIGWAKPGQRPKAPEPPTPPANAPPGQPAEENPEATERPQPSARIVALASGILARKSKGFIDGQLYADAVVEASTAAGEKALEPTLDAILEELEAVDENADDPWEDLRGRLRARYATLSAEELSELMFRSMVVAELAGRHAVNVDAPAADT